MSITGVELLKLIASHDDIIKFCTTPKGFDLTLADKYISHFGSGRSASFDPIMSAVNNYDWLDKINVWSSKATLVRRTVGTFDEELYTKEFIKARMLWIQDSEKNKEPASSGFDCYAHLMAYEKDIETLYGAREDLTLLQRAALHKIETKSDDVELDYLTYVATYDDIILGAVNSKPEDKTWEEHLPSVGKVHYENVGKKEIHEGKREVLPFFDPDQYVASYSDAIAHLQDENGEIDETKVKIVYITYGFCAGLTRSTFDPYKIIASNVDMVKDAIYTAKKIDVKKVAKVWIQRVKAGLHKSDDFDEEEYKKTHELEDTQNPCKTFVEEKVQEYAKLVKKQSSYLYKLKKTLGLKRPQCLAPKAKA